jgi:hypothetical protein
MRGLRQRAEWAEGAEEAEGAEGDKREKTDFFRVLIVSTHLWIKNLHLSGG